MKKQILTISLVAFVAASSFGQGQVNFKTSAKNLVYSSTDGTTASLAAVPTTGVVGSFGTVSYELLTAPSTTALLTSESQFLNGTSIVAPTGWTATALTPVNGYGSPGAITAFTLTLPASAGAAGNNVDLEVVAFTGSANNVTMFGYSGQTFPTLTSANGTISWSEPTGNPNSTPTPGSPATIPINTSGFGSIVLEQVPEPSTIALGGLAVATLLAFRRRK